MSPTTANRSSLVPEFLRDIRVLQALGQIIAVVVVVTALSLIFSAISTSLSSKNLSPTFNFLDNRAGFDISNAPAWYSSDSSYWAAFRVGMSNTLRVVVIGLFLTTLVGVLVGIFLLSSNWLVRTIARLYVEALRNTPLLAQLFVWYFIVVLSLPSLGKAFTFPNEGVILLSLRLLLYILAFIFIRFWTRNLPTSAPRRSLATFALFGVVAAAEIAFRLAGTQESWKALYGSGNLGSIVFWLYALVSLGLIAAAWYWRSPLRWQALGLAVGQLIGGLLFYFGIIPTAGLRTEIYPAIYVSVRGFVFPEIAPSMHFAEWMVFVAAGLALAVALWLHFGHVTETTGRQIRRGWYALLIIVGFAAAGWVFVLIEPSPEFVPVTQEADGATVMMSLADAQQNNLLDKAEEQAYTREPLWFSLPELKVNKAGVVNGFINGTEVQPEYMALLIGLVVYTSSFIAEIVRAGILAVPRGQIEASRALGLTTGQTIRIVILPQALRVIIPPLGNQYLNLSKNSSLAVAIAYADVVFVTQTIMNQSGQSVTGILMLMIFYLTISLTISFVTNAFNRRFKLVTR